MLVPVAVAQQAGSGNCTTQRRVEPRIDAGGAS